MRNEDELIRWLVNIAGKDYLSEAEAAHCACLSLSKFREKAAQFGVFPIRVFGTTKKVYRRADIHRAIEASAQCQHSKNAAKAGS
jgi:hypothetical protein